MTQREISARYRQRHPERQRLFRMIGNLKRRGASPAKIRKFQEALKATPLELCPVCQRHFRECDRKDSECRAGWSERQYEKAVQSIEQWPEWMKANLHVRRAVEEEQRAMTQNRSPKRC